MSTQNRISKALAALLPGGALGDFILLALSAPSITDARSSQAAYLPPPLQCLRATRRPSISSSCSLPTFEILIAATATCPSAPIRRGGQQWSLH
jgi:hypothetical protein